MLSFHQATIIMLACNQSQHIDWLHFRFVAIKLQQFYCILSVSSLSPKWVFHNFSSSNYQYAWSSFSVKDFAYYFTAKLKWYKKPSLPLASTSHSSALGHTYPEYSEVSYSTLTQSSFLFQKVSSVTYIFSSSFYLSYFLYLYVSLIILKSNVITITSPYIPP